MLSRMVRDGEKRGEERKGWLGGREDEFCRCSLSFRLLPSLTWVDVDVVVDIDVGGCGGGRIGGVLRVIAT